LNSVTRMKTKLLKIQVFWDVALRRASCYNLPATQRHFPDDLSRKQHLCKNLKSRNNVDAE
jgi:hypothetical protein